MKKITLLFGALLLAIASFAAKTTAVVTAGEEACYIAGEEVLTVTGLSAQEVGYNGTLVLQVYGWDGGELSGGYAAILSNQGDEVASCDEGLMIVKDQEGLITLTGKMIGYPYDYQIEAQVGPKQAKTIQVVSDKMYVEVSPTDDKDLRLTAKTNGYTIEIDLYRAVSKQYGTYAANQLFATINSTNVSFADADGVATYSLEGETVKFEAAFIYNLDTLELTLTGYPYVKPEDIVPVDTVDLQFVNAKMQYKMGMNRIEASSTNPEASLFIGHMGKLLSTVDAADFTYSSALVLEGDEISFLRGSITVEASGDDKVATAGLLGNDRVWYNMQLTTATELQAEEDVIEVTFEKFYNEPLYTPEETITGRNGNTVTVGGDWLISLKNDEAQFTFDYYGGTPDAFIGSYTIDNIDTDFSYGYYQGTRVDYVTCDLSITETHPTATLTRYVLVANIMSEDSVHYLVQATHDILTASETVKAEILDAQITPTDYGFMLIAKSDEQNLDIQLAINWSFGVTGYFSIKVVDTVNTVITHNGNSFDPLEFEMEVAFANQLTSGYPGYTIPSLRFMSPDVVEYDLKIEAPIVVTDTVDITCTNLVWDESQKAESAIMFEAADENYAIFGMLSETSIKVGTYDSEKATVEITHTATEKSIGALMTTVVVAGNQLKKDFTVECEVLGDDNKLYLIHLSASEETTDLDSLEVQAPSQKLMRNGELIIIRDGEMYNAQGARL